MRVRRMCALVFLCLGATSPASVDLIELHSPDGGTVFVNPAEISSLRQPNNADLGRYFPHKTRCVVVTTNGKFVASIETCASIRDRLAAH